MKIFVSWSGELSQKFADLLKTWIEQCIQSADVFFSRDDIEKGERWDARLTSELNTSNFGIVCLTKENIGAPWIHFEAGALSKMLDAKVNTLLIGINVSDIKGPLSTFQATRLEEDDMYKLLTTINKIQEKPLTEEKLKTAFSAFWPDFIKSANKLQQEYSKNSAEAKSTKKINIEEAIEEILQLTRSQSFFLRDPTNIIPVEYLENISLKRFDCDEICDELYRFLRDACENIPFEGIGFFKSPYFRRLEYFIMRHLTRNLRIWHRKFGQLFDMIHVRFDEIIETKTANE